jgi:hypothetical protein
MAEIASRMQRLPGWLRSREEMDELGLGFWVMYVYGDLSQLFRSAFA